MNRLKAAIIDDGAHPQLFNSSEGISVDGYSDVKEGAFNENYCSHATECMALIRKFTSLSDINWLNIRVLDNETYSGSIDRFIRALEICLEKNVKLIHMSIGSEYFMDFPKIKEITEKLLANGAVLIASMSNSGKLTYPACISGVIGVKSGDGIENNGYIYVDSPFDSISFIAGSEHEIRLFDVEYITQKCNSMAAPVITAKVIDILRNSPEADSREVADELKKSALSIKKEDIYDETGEISEEELQTPVLGIYLSDQKSSVELAEGLHKLFEADGYNAAVCSSSYGGYRKLPEKCLPAYFSRISDFCMCDIILVCINDSSIFEKFNSFDIVVADDITVCPEKYEIIISAEKDKADIYSDILRKFNE